MKAGCTVRLAGVPMTKLEWWMKKGWFPQKMKDSLSMGHLSISLDVDHSGFCSLRR